MGNKIEYIEEIDWHFILNSLILKSEDEEIKYDSKTIESIIIISKIIREDQREKQMESDKQIKDLTDSILRKPYPELEE